ncbi:MAG: hypothetical protein KC416_17000, partial [Myxococcales bacterium]|nr:hypothetical protein [Myxococcales bacterium]
EGASKEFIGAHDFRAFRATGDVRETTVRTLTEVSIEEAFGGHDSLLAIYVTGDAFLKNMVRIIVGTLLDVGRGRLTSADVRALLTEEGQRKHAGETAPPQGLTLLHVHLGRNGANRV